MIWGLTYTEMFNKTETIKERLRITLMAEDLKVSYTTSKLTIRTLLYCGLYNIIFIEMVKSGGVSSQIDFARAGIFNEVRKDDKTTVEMYPEWKRK